MSSMSKSYPNRQTIFIAIICVLAVGGVLVYIQPGLLHKKSTWKNVEVVTNNKESLSQNFDTISDSDWQKSFASSSQTTKKTASSTDGTPITLTDKLGRDFFEKFALLKQGNLTSDQKTVETAMLETLKNTVNSASSPKYYTNANIIISDNYDNIMIRNYGNNIGNIFVKNAPKADPTTIVTEALEKEDMDILAKLDPVIASYKKITESILSTTVPRPLAKYHLDLANSVSAMLFVSQKSREFNSDPAQSIIGLDLYIPARDGIKKALREMNDYFDNNKIYYSNTEPGILFATVPK